jgi:hypothetical protein
VFAEKSGHYQQAPKDSIPKKIIGKVKITVKDLMDGSGWIVFTSPPEIKEVILIARVC